MKDVTPHQVTFFFDSEEDKRIFLAQMSDGVGENAFNLDWPDGENLFDTKFVWAEYFEEDYE